MLWLLTPLGNASTIQSLGWILNNSPAGALPSCIRSSVGSICLQLTALDSLFLSLTTSYAVILGIRNFQTEDSLYLEFYKDCLVYCHQMNTSTIKQRPHL